MELPWDSLWTWVICFFVVDLAYYVFHRTAHEVNFFWFDRHQLLTDPAAIQAFFIRSIIQPQFLDNLFSFRSQHVVHHSSQYYNFTTALRQSVIQAYFSFLFYLPGAVVVHPLAYAAHGQLNTLYQFWIHTETIPKLGPLEWVLNTPSHHRVHHGSNRYCIDKNYGLSNPFTSLTSSFQPVFFRWNADYLGPHLWHVRRGERGSCLRPHPQHQLIQCVDHSDTSHCTHLEHTVVDAWHRQQAVCDLQGTGMVDWQAASGGPQRHSGCTCTSEAVPQTNTHTNDSAHCHSYGVHDACDRYV